ncbi:M6 family metalloprotease domain-containing protein, partial [Streptomyces sp. TRM76130]|nr:M6 family metalloprotease domain-containing protein [Streptomyces sp. TRM76130]
MQPQRRRIRPRRVAALLSVTALTLTVSTSAGTGPVPSDTASAGAAPASLSRSSAHGPCMITGGPEVQMSEGVPTSPGYSRSTGTVRA